MKIVNIFFLMIFLFLSCSTKDRPKNVEVKTKKKTLSATKVAYECGGKIISADEFSKLMIEADKSKTNPNCGGLVITTPENKKIKLENESRPNGDGAFYFVKRLHENFAFVTLRFMGYGTYGYIYNLFDNNESYSVGIDPEPLYSPDKKYVLFKGLHIPGDEGYSGLHLDIFNLSSDLGIAPELGFRYENEPVECLVGEKCLFTSYFEMGAFTDFQWQSNTKLVAKRCSYDPEKNKVDKNNCQPFFAEKVGGAWKTSIGTNDFSMYKIGDCGMGANDASCLLGILPEQKVTLVNFKEAKLCEALTSKVLNYVPYSDEGSNSLPSRIVTSFKEKDQCKPKNYQFAIKEPSMQAMAQLKALPTDQEIKQKIENEFKMIAFKKNSKFIGWEPSTLSDTIFDIKSYEGDLQILQLTRKDSSSKLILLHTKNGFEQISDECGHFDTTPVKMNDTVFIITSSVKCESDVWSRTDVFILKDKVMKIFTDYN